MKKILLLCALLQSHCFAMGQNVLTSTHNALRSDSINKEIIAPFDAGCEGENVTWDFTDMDINDAPDTTDVRLYDFGNRFLWDDNGAMTTYRQLADTLSVTREESPIFEMDYSTAVLKMLYPFRYGSVASAPFSGKGSYEGKIALAEIGTSQITGDAQGTLILAAGDTLKNTLRVHTVINSNVELSERQTGKAIMNIHKTTDIFEWYARGYRYPVLKMTELKLFYGGKPVFMDVSASRMSPEMQEAVEDSENEQLRNINSGSSIISYDVAVNGYSATVTYSLSEDAHVGMTLADSRGILYWRHDAEVKAGEQCQTAVPLSGLLRGQYVIYINVNGTVESCKVNVE